MVHIDTLFALLHIFVVIDSLISVHFLKNIHRNVVLQKIINFKEALKSVLRIFSEHNKVCYFRLDRYYFKSIKPMTVTYK